MQVCENLKIRDAKRRAAKLGPLPPRGDFFSYSSAQHEFFSNSVEGTPGGFQILVLRETPLEPKWVIASTTSVLRGDAECGQFLMFIWKQYLVIYWNLRGPVMAKGLSQIVRPSGGGPPLNIPHIHAIEAEPNTGEISVWDISNFEAPYLRFEVEQSGKWKKHPFNDHCVVQHQNMIIWSAQNDIEGRYIDLEATEFFLDKFHFPRELEALHLPVCFFEEISVWHTQIPQAQDELIFWNFKKNVTTKKISLEPNLGSIVAATLNQKNLILVESFGIEVFDMEAKTDPNNLTASVRYGFEEKSVCFPYPQDDNDFSCLPSLRFFKNNFPKILIVWHLRSLEEFWFS